MISNLKQAVPQTVKNLYHLIKAIMANVWFGFPSRKIIVIGVTGTNGKTTTTQMIGKIIEVSGRSVAVTSTINFRINKKTWKNKSKFTTLSAWQVQQFIYQAVKAGCQFLVLETSSHALDQNRVWGVDYDVAVITNVTREHLDYHKSMEGYAKAKARLFELLVEKRLFLYKIFKKTTKKVAIANMTCDYCSRMLLHGADKKYGYSIRKGKGLSDFSEQIKILRAKEIKESLKGTEFKVGNQIFNLKIPGKVNIENAMAAISTGSALGLGFEVMAQALHEIDNIPGRMEHVENERGISIIIDYALTPDSMEKLGKMTRERANATKGKIIWVFGSCGQRDRGKRPIMGKIASQYSDYIVLTNEDPYNEDPQQIINEVKKGVKDKKEGERLWILMDRRSAIKKAIDLAKPGDIVLVTGKGAEENMAIGSQIVPWNDRKVIKEVLKNYSKKSGSSGM